MSGAPEPAGGGHELGAGTWAVDRLLDATWLSAVVGRPVVADRLRHKPGVSTVAAYREQSGVPSGWAHLVAPTARDKVDNALRRATGRRRPVQAVDLPGGWCVVHGPVRSDPRLHRALDQLPDALLGELAPGGEVTVLRYNPHRRLVLRRGASVVRLTSARQRWLTRAAGELGAHGVPLVVPAPLGDIHPGRRVSVWPWLEGGDLLTRPDPVSARSAGAVLAALHTVPVPDIGLDLPAPVIRTGLDRVVAEVHGLAPALAESARTVAATALDRLPGDGPTGRVWCHGDFSADQVLAPTGGGVRLIDVDRTCLAPAGLDLGSFCAVEALRGEQGDPGADLSGPLLEGYAGAGGTVPDPRTLAGWTAYAMATRVTTPVRHARPTWRAELAGRLRRIEEVLGR